MRRRSFWLHSLIAVLTLVAPAHAQFSFVSFPGSAYDPNEAIMNANLGITGYVFEAFEDVNLLPGLQVRFGGSIPDVTYSVLPALFDTTNFPNIDGFTSFANNLWDGPHALANGGNGTNQFKNPFVRETTFLFSPGVRSVGVGLANFQSAAGSPTNPYPKTDHELLVNGVSMGTLETLCGSNWIAGIDVRNAYIRVDATGSADIQSILIRNLTGGDALVFDHLAVSPSASSVSLSALSFKPGSVKGGLSVTGTIKLKQPAPTGGCLVTLTSANPSVVSVPDSVMIPGGMKSVTFTATTTAVAKKTKVNITAAANFGLTVKSKKLTIKP